MNCSFHGRIAIPITEIKPKQPINSYSYSYFLNIPDPKDRFFSEGEELLFLLKKEEARVVLVLIYSPDGFLSGGWVGRE